jgi:hypothetical protein
MATIDIPLPNELTQALNAPPCLDLSLPKVGTASLTLPMGGTLQGMADFTRGIPTDCSMNLNLMLQLAPMMASMECLLKILKFIAVAVDLLENISSPFDLVTAAGKIVSAAEDLKACFEIVTPLGPICTFVRDLLKLISTMILCVVTELESILKILSGLQLQISIAEANGNADLLEALSCAQQNAQTSADGAMQSMQPIIVLLSLAETFIELAGAPVNIPTIPSAVPADDLEAMQTLLSDLAKVAAVIKEVAESLPC